MQNPLIININGKNHTILSIFDLLPLAGRFPGLRLPKECASIMVGTWVEFQELSKAFPQDEQALFEIFIHKKMSLLDFIDIKNCISIFPSYKDEIFQASIGNPELTKHIVKFYFQVIMAIENFGDNKKEAIYQLAIKNANDVTFMDMLGLPDYLQEISKIYPHHFEEMFSRIINSKEIFINLMVTKGYIGEYCSIFPEKAYDLIGKYNFYISTAEVNKESELLVNEFEKETNNNLSSKEETTTDYIKVFDPTDTNEDLSIGNDELIEDFLEDQLEKGEMVEEFLEDQQNTETLVNEFQEFKINEEKMEVENIVKMSAQPEIKSEDKQKETEFHLKKARNRFFIFGSHLNPDLANLHPDVPQSIRDAANKSIQESNQRQQNNQFRQVNEEEINNNLKSFKSTRSGNCG